MKNNSESSIGARRIEHLLETLGKRRINLRFRRRLPLNSQYALTQPLKIWKSDEGPLRTSAHVDQYRPRFPFQTCPNFLHRHIIDVDGRH